MPKYFCIDQGNTKTKWAIMQDGSIIAGGDERLAFADVLELCDEHQVEGIGICTVTGEISPESFGHRYPIVFIDDGTRIPILNAYATKDTLGADRIAMVCGAYALYPMQFSIVIGLGTCITYNFLTDKGVFRGGAITPGLYMRLHALHDYTAGLPLVTPREPIEDIGYDTTSSIQTGVYYGIVDEIDGMIERYGSKTGNINAILTGGDADFFASQVKNRIFVDSNLVFKGIYAITEYNL